MKTCLFTLLTLITLQANAQEQKIIKLKSVAATYAPKNFHIVSVTDDREDTTTIGAIRVGLGNKRVGLNLQGGTASSIFAYINTQVEQKPGTSPVSMHIKQLQAREEGSSLAPKEVVEISVGYYLQDQLLVEYSGNASQQSTAVPASVVESLIRKNLNETLTRFDDWWSGHKNQFSSTGKIVATNVKVGVTEGTTNGDASQILFDTRRMLTLDDFQGQPDELNPGAAAVTYSSIAVAFNSQIQDGKATVKVTVTPTFSITKSWCRPNGRNARTLSHEQIHFNLTGLKACELMTTIKNYPFTPENYDKELNELQDKAIKELDAEQNLYDKQTNHGLVAAEQARWSKEVSKRLLAQVCY